jgi:hypothetical protein
MPIKFNSKELPDTQNEYVCWIDIMGTKNIMTDSLQTASNFIFKFHTAVMECKNPDARYYPLMDGVFITTKSKTTMESIVSTVFQKIAVEFISETKNKHRFLIKGTISYGPIIHGEDVSKDACEGLAREDEYRKSILMGIPMIQAYLVERNAPPFGIFIHESARTFHEPKRTRLSGKYYHWTKDKDLRRNLLSSINDYFSWTENYSVSLNLEKSKSQYYKVVAEEYFNNFT